MNLVMMQTGEQSMREETGPYKILIVDDHPVAQGGLRMLFAQRDGYEIVGALESGATVNAFVQSQPVDLVILDLNMPDVRGVDVLADLVGSRDMTVIILTGEGQLAEIEYALKLGARGVVSKGDPIEQVLAACEAALAGDLYLSTQMRERMAQQAEQAVALSPRQMAILHYLARGETNKEISYRLSIAQPTVSFHIGELRRKLELKNNRQIVERARELGLV